MEFSNFHQTDSKKSFMSFHDTPFEFIMQLEWKKSNFIRFKNVSGIIGDFEWKSHDDIFLLRQFCAWIVNSFFNLNLNRIISSRLYFLSMFLFFGNSQSKILISSLNCCCQCWTFIMQFLKNLFFFLLLSSYFCFLNRWDPLIDFHSKECNSNYSFNISFVKLRNHVF